MKLLWKGKFTNNDELAINLSLPKNAVKFKEPDNLGQFLRQSLVFVVPVFALVILAEIAKVGLHGAYTSDRAYLGLMLAFLAFVPHELMHAALYPSDAPVEVWCSTKHMAAFVYCQAPVSRARFIALSMFPNVVLGLLPLSAWVLMPPQHTFLSGNLRIFATINLLSGIGDYLNVYNTWRQVPKHGMVQNSSIHSYWYVEKA
ncbi:MAG: DUF3267 domain-containing protein [Peptococcaceae bacterium]|nr:DUF3267 domain-containing protein [Peptococcaceae bacterium]